MHCPHYEQPLVALSLLKIRFLPAQCIFPAADTVRPSPCHRTRSLLLLPLLDEPTWGLLQQMAPQNLAPQVLTAASQDPTAIKVSAHLLPSARDFLLITQGSPRPVYPLSPPCHLGWTTLASVPPDKPSCGFFTFFINEIFYSFTVLHYLVLCSPFFRLAAFSVIPSQVLAHIAIYCWTNETQMSDGRDRLKWPIMSTMPTAVCLIFCFEFLFLIFF